MADKDIFKQQRAPINPNEFDGSGQEENEADSMRSHLLGGLQHQNFQPSSEPPPTLQMSGNIPPQVQAAMNHPQFVGHPLKQQTPPQQPMLHETEDFQMPQNMTDASSMYANAKKLIQQKQNPQQQQPEAPKFNPEFSKETAMQRATGARYNDFKDANYESVMDQLNKLSNNYEQISLPSKGKFYLNGEGPSNGILHLRRMTAADEQILYNPRLAKRNQSLNMVFKECIGEKIDPDYLLSEDRNYILIYLRSISQSYEYDVEVKCPECGKAFQNKIYLNNLDMDYCPDDFGPEDLYDELPVSGLKVKYRLSTGRDEVAVQERKDDLVRKWGSEVNDDSALFRLTLLIEEIGGVNQKLMIQQIIAKLPVGDVNYLRTLVNEPPFGVNTKIGIVCPHCFHEFEMQMPMELGFFFPKSKLPEKKRKRA